MGTRLSIRIFLTLRKPSRGNHTLLGISESWRFEGKGNQTDSEKKADLFLHAASLNHSGYTGEILRHRRHGDGGILL